jgi:cysteinyl-tRNA synthetase
VCHVENFTDVNEKIVGKIGVDGDGEATVARHHVAGTIADMRSLNCKRADVYPRVSEHVPEIVGLVEDLIAADHAYESNGSVYFDVTSFADYGHLSNQDVTEIEAQGHEDERSEKRHPADFALWKAGAVDPADANEHRPEDAEPLTESAGQTWDSPWGRGRPGWHVECSAMSMAHLDETLDIHVGGQDLVFPHHENEIAQSEAATGQRFANYWLHVGLLETKGEKMSSSLGNYRTVRDAVDDLGSNVVRTFLLSTAYHNRATLSEDTLSEAEERWEHLERGYERAVDRVDSPDAATTVTDETLCEAVDATRESFVAAMNDDFNTRRAITALLELVSALNRHVDDRERYDYQGLHRAVETLTEFGEGVLGLRFGGPDASSDDRAGDLVELVLSIREREREDGNYDRADELRETLSDLGIEVQDTDDGPTYRL